MFSFPVRCPDGARCDDRRFYDVTPGDSVEFELAFSNDLVPSRPSAQVFRATLAVLGNGVAELDTREIVIVVPAGSEVFVF